MTAPNQRYLSASRSTQPVLNIFKDPNYTPPAGPQKLALNKIDGSEPLTLRSAEVNAASSFSASSSSSLSSLSSLFSLPSLSLAAEPQEFLPFSLSSSGISTSSSASFFSSNLKIALQNLTASKSIIKTHDRPTGFICWQQSNTSGACSLCTLLNAFQIDNLNDLAEFWLGKLSSSNEKKLSAILENINQEGMSENWLKYLANEMSELQPSCTFNTTKALSAFYAYEKFNNPILNNHVNAVVNFEGQGWFVFDSVSGQVLLIKGSDSTIPEGREIMAQLKYARGYAYYLPDSIDISRVSSLYLPSRQRLR